VKDKNLAKKWLEDKQLEGQSFKVTPVGSFPFLFLFYFFIYFFLKVCSNAMLVINLYR